MPLQSPGVEVTVIDESFYTPAEPGTTPLLVVATAENKRNAAGTGTAAATTQANAGVAFRLTSQKDLVDLFGLPFFEQTASGSAIHGGERNEYGLLTAYSFLGVSNNAFVVRANIDLNELEGTASEPAGRADDEQWWVNTGAIAWGIQEWNSAAADQTGGQKFTHRVPLVLTDDDSSKVSGTAPLASVGSLGDYAAVFLTGTAANETAKIYFKSPGGSIANNAGVVAGQWVLVGSPEWCASHPTISGTVTIATLTSGHTFEINGNTITIGGATVPARIATLVSDLNQLSTQGISARVLNDRVLIYSDGSTSSTSDSTLSGAIVIGTGSGSVLTDLGILPGTYLQPKLVQAPHTQVPPYKRTDNSTTIQGFPTGSIWIKTTQPNNGSDWIISKYNADLNVFTAFATPLHTNTHAALHYLDRSGGGFNLPVDTLFVQYNATENFSYVPPDSGLDTRDSELGDAQFRIWRRSTTGNTIISSARITTANITNTTVYRFSIKESTGALNLSAPATIQFTGQATAGASGNAIAAAINAAGLLFVEAAYDATESKITIFHKSSGDFRLTDIQNAPLATLFGTGYNVVTNTGTANFYALGGDAASGPVQTFVVTSVPNPGQTPPNFIFQIDGVNYPVLNLVRGGVYTFDQSAQSNTNHQIAFRLADGVTSFTTGVVTTGTAGTPGAKTVFTVPANAPSGLVYYCVQHGNGMGNTIAVTTAAVSVSTGIVTGASENFLASNWKPLITEAFAASSSAPDSRTADGQLWYNPAFGEVDIMVHNGNTWVGYRTVTSPYYAAAEADRTDPLGPIVAASEPTTQSDGTDLKTGDLWISTADLENFPIIYYWDDLNKQWELIDKTDQTTDEGILFADARYRDESLNAVTPDGAGTPSSISDLLNSNFLDFDAPDPDLFPRGMWLWNTRRSGGNVKRYQRNYITTSDRNIRFDAVNSLAGLPVVNGQFMTNYALDRWTTASANNEDGSGSFGRKAQRKVVVSAMKSVIDTSEQIRDTERRNFNIIAAPGYPEALSNLINLNIDRGLTAFVIGDTPLRLASDATTLVNWGTNANLVFDNGDDGIVSFDEFCAVYYPNGFTTDLGGNNVVVPASHMMLRTIALSDQVSFPWFAPAGTRRGGITNATAVGFIDSRTGEFQTVAVNEGTRDVLYDLKVNPIPFFVGSGLVAFGQKTRARNASALDRINVARLVIYLRSQLAKLARPYIFEPNDQITRDEVKGAVESLLLELVGLRALFDFAVVCDETNNTPSRIDRNELYVDIAIEPVKAIEFIYIPLRVKNTGEI